MRTLATSALGAISLLLAVWTVGCDGSNSSSRGAADTPPDAIKVPPQEQQVGTGTETTPAPSDQADVARTPPLAAGGSAATGQAKPAPIPPPDVPDDAPVLGNEYPALTEGMLRHARLVELSPGLLLHADGVLITKAEVEEQIKQAPQQLREQLQKNAFLLLEQKATGDLLGTLARKDTDNPAGLGEQKLIQQYFQKLTRAISVTDSEVKKFYDENRELVGNAPLGQVQDRIRQHLRQQKQQQAVEAHIKGLGKEMTIAVSAAWVKEQAPRVLDNPVDKARGNSTPTFVNFGAEGCVPCDRMAPIREKLAKELKGKVDVVFVHVRQEQILASRYGVRGIPHLIFFDKNGDVVHTHTGFMPEEQIREWLKKIGVTGS